jgi:hypothetical protein
MNLSGKIIPVTLSIALVSCGIIKTDIHKKAITSGSHIEAKYIVAKNITGIDIGQNKSSITLEIDGRMKIVYPTGAVEGGAKYMTLTHEYGIVGDTIFANGPFYHETKYLMDHSKDSIKMVYPEENTNWTHVRTTVTSEH